MFLLFYLKVCSLLYCKGVTKILNFKPSELEFEEMKDHFSEVPSNIPS